MRRRMLRTVAGLPVVERAVRALATRVPRRRDVLAVLTFHRVATGDGVVPGLLSATPEGFARMLDIAMDAFTVISIEDVLARRYGGPPLPARSLLLTFDDGYEDLADHAWPALTERGLPAIVFVPTAFPAGPHGPGSEFWWERLWAAIRDSPADSVEIAGTAHPVTTDQERTAAYRDARSWIKQLPHLDVEAAVSTIEAAAGFAPGNLPTPSGRPLDWDRLRALQAAGLALGSHTRTHPLLTRVDDETIRREIIGGVEDLRRETGMHIPAFAFPSGALHGAAAPALAEAGIHVAFSTRRGVNDLADPQWLELRRVNMSVTTPASAVLVQAVR
jgi:peptidoglycan/xylan/chitin deacetylase (PgdA/CDA1 family)